MNAFELRKNIYNSIEILHTNPTPKQFIIYSLQRKCQHEITLTYCMWVVNLTRQAAISTEMPQCQLKGGMLNQTVSEYLHCV